MNDAVRCRQATEIGYRDWGTRFSASPAHSTKSKGPQRIFIWGLTCWPAPGSNDITPTILFRLDEGRFVRSDKPNR